VVAMRISKACRALAVAYLMLSMASCGTAHYRESSAVRVGAVSISAAEVDHWTQVLRRRFGDGGLDASALKTRAVRYLVQSSWLIEEMHARGLKPPEQMIARETRDQVGGLLSSAEVADYLRATGETKDDLRRDAERELAERELRNLLERKEQPLTEEEIQSYYREHRQRYVESEARYFEIVNNLNYKGALRVRRAVVHDGVFPVSPLHEALEKDHYFPSQGKLHAAVFSTGLHGTGGPVKLNDLYSVFRVTRIVPRHYRLLASVSHDIRIEAAEEIRSRHLEKTVREISKQWKAHTECAPGYQVAGCREYVGPEHAMSTSLLSEG
jgi:SurA N-terminal domain